MDAATVARAAAVAHVFLSEYTDEYMPTTVHIPSDLLKVLDKKSKVLGVSRNRLIVNAIERDLGADRGWPPGFFESIGRVSEDLKQMLDETMASVARRRMSKKPLDL